MASVAGMDYRSPRVYGDILTPRVAAIVQGMEKSPASYRTWPHLTTRALKALLKSPWGTGEPSTQQFLNAHPQFTDLFDALALRQRWYWEHDPYGEFHEIYNKLEEVLALPSNCDGNLWWTALLRALRRTIGGTAEEWIERIRRAAR